MLSVSQWLQPSSPSSRLANFEQNIKTSTNHHPYPVAIESLAEFKNQYESSDESVVLLVVKATWCGYCKLITPLIKQLALNNPNVLVLELETQAKSPNIEPQFSLFKDVLQCKSYPSLYVWNKHVPSHYYFLN